MLLLLVRLLIIFIVGSCVSCMCSCSVCRCLVCRNVGSCCVVWVLMFCCYWLIWCCGMFSGKVLLIVFFRLLCCSVLCSGLLYISDSSEG